MKGAINLKTLSMSNFMSFGRGPTVLDLDQKKTTLIRGKNLDVGAEGESANGVGKSTMMQAVVFALYGKGIDKMKADEFINLANGKKLRVELTFEKGGSEYRIVRGRKPNLLEFYYIQDGEEVSLTRDSMKNTDEDIMRVIEVPHEIFISTVFMSPHIDSFLSMSPAEQRNFMENLLSLDKLAERAETLKKVVRKDLEEEVKLADRDLERAQENNEKVAQNIARIRQSAVDFDQKKESNLKRLADELGTLPEYGKEAVEIFARIDSERIQVQNTKEHLQSAKMSLKEAEADLKLVNNLISQLSDLRDKEASFGVEQQRKLKVLEDSLSKLEDREYCEEQLTLIEKRDSLKADLKILESDKAKVSREMESISDKMDKLAAQAETLAEGRCPYCSQEHYDQEKVDALISEVEALDEKHHEMYHTLHDEFEPRIAAAKEELGELDEAITLTNPQKILDERSRISDQISYAKANSQNPYEADLATFIEENGDEDDLASLQEAAQEAVTGAENQVARLETLKIDFETSLEVLMASEEIRGLSSVADIDRINQRKEQLRASIAEAEEQVNPYEGEEEHLNDMMVDVDELQTIRDDLDESLTHVNYLIKLLTDPKSFIRRNIIDQYIPILNQRINGYAEKLGLPHVVEIRSDMTVDIEYMTKPVSYYMMSRGERLRVNMATSLAFRELMALLGRGFNILLIDELLDGSADTAGMHAIFKMINGYADNVMIISHREEFITAVDAHMTVIKKNGFADLSFD